MLDPLFLSVLEYTCALALCSPCQDETARTPFFHDLVDFYGHSQPSYMRACLGPALGRAEKHGQPAQFAPSAWNSSTCG